MPPLAILSKRLDAVKATISKFQMLGGNVTFDIGLLGMLVSAPPTLPHLLGMF